jgi:hypothetical protein
MKLRLLAFAGAGLALALTAIPLRAATHTWTGNGRDALWSNPANWTTSAAPDARDASLQLVFPVHARASQQPVNNIPGLVVTSLTLSGSNYELDALSASHGLAIAAGGTVTCSGTNNSVAPLLGLSVNSGIANVAVAGSAVFHVHSAIAGPGSITKSGTGTWWIEGAAPNTFAQLFVTGGLAGLNKPAGTTAVGGGVEIHPGGTLRLNAANQIPDHGEVVMVASSLAALPVLDLNRHDETVAGLSGTGVIELGDTISFPLPLGSATLTIDQTNATRVFSGPIHGVGGSIRKRGPGSLSFNYSLLPGAGAVSTYSGLTDVVAGEVYFNRPVPNTGVQVSGAAQVGGTRTPGIAGAPTASVGRLNLAFGACAPGAHALGVETPLASGGLGMRSSSRFVARLVSPTVYHRANVSGQVWLEGPVLELAADYQPSAGTTFTLIDNAGTDAVIGYFAALPEGAALEANGLKYRVSYVGGDGNDVTLTRLLEIIPNPPPVLKLSSQPPPEGGSNGVALFASARAAARFDVEVNEDLADPLGWHWMSEAVADESGQLRFFDPGFGQQPKRFYRFAESALSPVVDPPPSSRFVSISNLPPEVVTAAQQYLLMFAPRADTPSAAESEWSSVALAPQATLIFDPSHLSGNEPAYAELKVVPAGRPQGEARGYLIVSLTENDSPIVEFNTRGRTKTDRLLARVPSGAPDKIFRFSPAYWVVENSAGQRLIDFGTPPVAFAGDLSPGDLSGSLKVNPVTGAWEITQLPARTYAPTFDYRAMKQAFLSNSAAAHFRSQRAQVSALRWNRLRGGRPTVLTVAPQETKTFLSGTPLNRVRLESENDSAAIAQLTIRREGGFTATGLRGGSALVRLVTETGQVQEYTLNVSAAGGGAAPMFQAQGACPSWTMLDWWAGAGWNADQRHYYQYSDEQWCPKVGCGPVALAMLLGWWDAHGVPSAFYKLRSGRGNAEYFRFDFDSLSTPDAPQFPDNSEALVRAVYDDLHGLCNTLCQATGAGATAPDQMASAFAEYMARVVFQQPAPMGEFGGAFVACAPEASWNDGFLLGGTDWQGGGKAVADGIINNQPVGSEGGRPGIVGIWAGTVLHYVLAYGYAFVKFYDDCAVVASGRLFRCNMGWGEAEPEWHDAEAVWFGLTANLWQNNTPVLPPGYVPPPETPPFDSVLDPDRCAAVLNDAGTQLDLFALAGRTQPGSFERVYSSDAGVTWHQGFDEVLTSGLFRSSPAASVSADGNIVDVFGRGMDDRLWRNRSLNGGGDFAGWMPVTHPSGVTGDGYDSAPAAAGSANGQILHLMARWSSGKFFHTRLTPASTHWSGPGAVGSGYFESAPALACSGDGQKVHAFGKGLDQRIYWSTSSNAGTNWTDWVPIGMGTFNSAPAAAASADGNSVHLVARGMDNRYWAVVGFNGVWSNWEAIGQGTFSSSPAVVCTANAGTVHVFGRGVPPPPPPQGTLPDPNLPRLWRTVSINGGSTWPYAWVPIEPQWE